MTKRLLSKILLSSILLLPAHYLHATVSQDKINSWKQKNGYITLSVPVKLDTLDPRLSMNAHSKFTLPLIFESLITISSYQELQPVLAKSWQIALDNKSITITLKPNHHFSDGTEVTARDVANSINRLCSPGSQEFGQLRSLIGCVEHAQGKAINPQVHILGKYIVKFNINSSPTTFLYQLSSPSTVIAKQTSQSLVGSGTYLINEKRAEYLILEKNPFYSGEVAIKNSGIILFYLSDQIVLSSMKELNLDGALMYRMESFWNFNNSNYKLIKSNPNITEILVLNNQKFPFNLPLVRAALSAEIYNNYDEACAPGSHKAYGIIPNGIGGSLTNMTPALLPKISPNDLFAKIPELKQKKTSMTIHELWDLKNECESKQIMKAAKKFNIDIKFEYHKDYSDLFPRILNHDLDGFLDLFIFKNREAYNIFDFFAKSGKNFANINDDGMNKLLYEAVSTPSSHARFQIYRKLADYVQDSHIVIPIFYMDHGNLMSKSLSGISEDFFFNPFLELPKISKTNLCEKN